MAKNKGLGRDFYSLIDDNMPEAKSEAKTTIKISRITPRGDQPRKSFDENALQILADSIREHGVIQPIVLRELDDVSENYEIIAGERRWRAARMAGLDEIPAVVMTGDELKIAEIALIENVQRKDLNPIEEAEGYRALMEDYAMTQEEVSSRIGKSRPAITNSLRLLSLHEEVRSLLEKGKLTAGHGRAIAGLSDPELQKQAAERVVYQGLSVRSTEKLVASLQRAPRRQKVDTSEIDYAAEESQNLTRALSRKCKIVQGRKAGRIVLEYYNDDDRELLLKNLYDMGKNWN